MASRQVRGSYLCRWVNRAVVLVGFPLLHRMFSYFILWVQSHNNTRRTRDISWRVGLIVDPQMDSDSTRIHRCTCSANQFLVIGDAGHQLYSTVTPGTSAFHACHSSLL